MHVNRPADNGGGKRSETKPKKVGSPGPKTASMPFMARSFDIASLPDETVNPASTYTYSIRIPPRKLGSALIRCTASAAAPGMVRPAFHGPVIGKSSPIFIEGSAA
jgi:hypothetical protein